MVYTHNGVLFNLKKNEILTHATIKMNPEHMVSEISLTQKDKYCIVPFKGGT